jgi:CrcB protein
METEPPQHRRVPAWAHVALGGLFGAAARDAVHQALPAAGGAFPWATFVVNLSGAFALGVLLEALVRAGGDRGRRRQARLVLGTGFLGAFTTYSTLAVEADLLVRGAHAVVAVLYVAASVVGGLLTVTAGMTVAAGGHRWQQARLAVDPDLDAEGDGYR